MDHPGVSIWQVGDETQNSTFLTNRTFKHESLATWQNSAPGRKARFMTRPTTPKKWCRRRKYSVKSGSRPGFISLVSLGVWRYCEGEKNPFSVHHLTFSWISLPSLLVSPSQQEEMLFFFFTFTLLTFNGTSQTWCYLVAFFESYTANVSVVLSDGLKIWLWKTLHNRFYPEKYEFTVYCTLQLSGATLMTDLSPDQTETTNKPLCSTILLI